MDSCCQVCSCASDCHVVGSCCPDVQHTIPSLPTYPCKYIDEILNSVRNVSLKHRGRNMYRIIDDCPNENSSRLFPACVQPMKLQDFIIVSDRANQKVFKNRHCSLCHGMADFIEWDLKTQCKIVPSNYFLTFEERDEFILQNCGLTAVPPNKIIDDITRCFDTMIQDCQGRQPVTEYDKLMEAACHKENLSQNTIYFMDGFWKLDVYKNIYCYLCAQTENVEMTDTCTARVYDSVKKLGPSLVAFSGILALSKSTSSYKNDVTLKCKSEDIWDPFVVSLFYIFYGRHM